MFTSESAQKTKTLRLEEAALQFRRNIRTISLTGGSERNVSHVRQLLGAIDRTIDYLNGRPCLRELQAESNYLRMWGGRCMSLNSSLPEGITGPQIAASVVELADAVTAVKAPLSPQPLMMPLLRIVRADNVSPVEGYWRCYLPDGDRLFHMFDGVAKGETVPVMAICNSLVRLNTQYKSLESVIESSDTQKALEHAVGRFDLFGREVIRQAEARYTGRIPAWPMLQAASPVAEPA